MAQKNINPGSAPLIWSDVADAYNSINDNFTELYASVGGDAVDFNNLGTSLIPRVTEQYDLGSSTKKWRDIWLSGSSIHLGDAVITSTGSTVNLPVGSTIGGLRVDENYFKFIAVGGQDNIEADDGTDTLTIASGNSGITLTTDATTDTLTITNSGVTSLSGTTGQIGVSQSTGGVTLTNLGVISATAGLGIGLNSSTGPVTITNTGVVGLSAGIGIQLSPRDPVTGVITITNNQPNIPQQVFNIVAVPTQTPLAADSTSDTLNIQTGGAGLSITTTPLTDTLTFTNTGVTSLAVGNGLTINAGTGAISLTLDSVLSRNLIGDVIGSVFADDSTKLVDAVEGLIIGNIDTGRLRTSESKIALGFEAGLTNQGAGTVAVGQYAGRTDQSASAVAVGGLAGNTNQGISATAVGVLAGGTNQGNGSVAVGNLAGGQDQGVNSIAIGQLAGGLRQGEYAIAIGTSAGGTDQPANSIVISATPLGLDPTAAGLFIDPIRNQAGTGNILQYNTSTKEIIYSSSLDGDLVGSVFADNSTLLVDAVNGVIPNANIEGWPDQNLNTTDSPTFVTLTATTLQVDNITIGVGGNVDGQGATLGNFSGINATTFTGNLNGDVNGSIYADDSTLLIDGTEGTINAAALTGTLPALDGSALTGVVADSVDWSDVSNTPTTLTGYGITDAATSSQGSLAETAVQPAALGSFTFTGSTLDTSDSSGINVVVQTTFNSDVIVENELFVGTSRVISISELKTIVAASTDFADFQTRIAAL